VWLCAAPYPILAWLSSACGDDILGSSEKNSVHG
jgi:hypothetical protein